MLSMKRKLDAFTHSDEESSSSSDETWTPGSDSISGEETSAVLTRSRGATVVQTADDAVLDKVDEVVDCESDFSTTTAEEEEEEDDYDEEEEEESDTEDDEYSDDDSFVTSSSSVNEDEQEEDDENDEEQAEEVCANDDPVHPA